MATNHQNVRNILNCDMGPTLVVSEPSPFKVNIEVVNQWRTDNTSGPKNKSPLEPPTMGK
jgi:hypothetical protein